MKDAFLQILNMSLRGSAVILAVLAARLLLRRFPKRYSYLLWLPVLLRLVCPVSFESGLGLLRRDMTSGYSDFGVAVSMGREVAASGGSATALPSNAPGAGQYLLLAAAFIWVLGAVLFFARGARSYLRLRKQVSGARELQPGVFEVEGIPSAFAMGILRPRIYLPSGLEPREREQLLLHERVHIRRGDLAVKLLFHLAVCLHWFNPLVFASFKLMVQDMESSCDEAVLRRAPQCRSDYAQSLLRFSMSNGNCGRASACFGEGSTKRRIENVLKFKKPAVAVSVVCALAVAALIYFLSADPIGSGLRRPDQQELQLATEAMQQINEQQSGGDATVTVVDVLHVERGEDTLTFYLWEHTGCFAAGDDGAPEQTSGSSLPCKLTFSADGSGGWGDAQAEYPSDGERYMPSLEQLCSDEDGREISGLAEALAGYPNTESFQLMKEAFDQKAAELEFAEPGPESSVAPDSLKWPAQGEIQLVRGFYDPHTGIDISLPEETPVYACADGVVVEAETDPEGGYGVYLMIDHGGGLATLYAHNQENLVSEGDRVAAGQQISLSGNTGNSTGPHLHLGVLLNGQPVDPMDYLE